MTTRPKSGYAPVNGIDLYYEIHGQGKPLILIHGGFGSIEMFGANLTALSAGREVIGIDLQGHGRTLPIDRPMTFTTLATDVAQLIRWLGYDKADVMGYSLGGATALRTAIDHPDVVDRLIVTSSCYALSGWHEFNRQGMKSMAANPAAVVEPMKQMPTYHDYLKLMPNPVANWPKTVAQTAALVGADYDWTDGVKGLAMPTLLMVADWDGVRISHATSFFELLGGGSQDANWDGSGMNRNRFAVIPGATHYNMFIDPRLATTAAQFLDA